MANLREKVDVEMENISIVLAELEKIKDKSDKTTAELAGMGTFLHNSTRKRLAKYLAFRHFFVHAYSFLLDERELKLLVDDVFDTYRAFEEETDTFISKKNSNEVDIKTLPNAV